MSIKIRKDIVDFLAKDLEQFRLNISKLEEKHREKNHEKSAEYFVSEEALKYYKNKSTKDFEERHAIHTAYYPSKYSNIIGCKLGGFLNLHLKQRGCFFIPNRRGNGLAYK